MLGSSSTMRMRAAMVSVNDPSARGALASYDVLAVRLAAIAEV
jgi:hypothetical protein